MKRIAALLSLCLLAGGCGHKATYAGGCGALPKGWITPRDRHSALVPLPNVIAVANDGSVAFNDSKVSRRQLAAYLRQAGALIPVPATHIVFARDVDCDTVADLRRLISTTLDCQHSACAEGVGKWRETGDVLFNGQGAGPFDPDATASPTAEP